MVRKTKPAQDETILAPEVNEVVEIIEVAEPVKRSVQNKEEVTVHYRGFSRVYSLKEHGDDFVALAEGFAKKVNGKVS